MRGYRLVATLADGSERRLICTSPITVNRWQPGSIPLFTDEFFKEPPDLPPGDVADVADSIKLPADLPPGSYVLSMGVVENGNPQPVVKLGIKGLDKDGWYPLSRLEVVK
jgi:hypothetical protein